MTIASNEEGPRREGLSDAKAALLDKWLRGRAPRTEPARSRIPRRERAEDAPLSFAQRRLWFLHQLDPASTAYNMFTYRRLRGPLQVDALAAALTDVVRRHEVLRTTYALGPDGTGHQAVHPPAPVPMPLVDLTAVPTAPEREAAARRVADEEAARGFDLSRDPVLRARLLRLAPDDHVLLLTVHHIAYDDWSERVLLQELAAHYAAAVAGRSAALPDTPVQYADYACWQRTAHETGRFREGVERWRARLAGAKPLELPTDRPRPPTRREEGAHASFRVPADVAERVGAFAKQEGATLFMTLLAAYMATLHRWTAQTDLSVGTPIAGRDEPETRDVVGFFVNTLVLRTGVTPDTPFRDLLNRVKATCASAYADAEVPFDVLVRELHPQRDPARTPLVQTIFLIQQEPLPSPSLGAARSEPFPVTVRTSKFDLTLLLRADAQGFEGIVEYDGALFEEDTIARFADGFAALLRHVLDHPDAPIREAPAPRARPTPAAPPPQAGRGATRSPTAPPTIERQARDRYRVPASTVPTPSRSPPRNDP